jgi:hypothetical protein
MNGVRREFDIIRKKNRISWWWWVWPVWVIRSRPATSLQINLYVHFSLLSTSYNFLQSKPTDDLVLETYKQTLTATLQNMPQQIKAIIQHYIYVYRYRHENPKLQSRTCMHPHDINFQHNSYYVIFCESTKLLQISAFYLIK